MTIDKSPELGIAPAVTVEQAMAALAQERQARLARCQTRMKALLDEESCRLVASVLIQQDASGQAQVIPAVHIVPQ